MSWACQGVGASRRVWIVGREANLRAGRQSVLALCYSINAVPIRCCQDQKCGVDSRLFPVMDSAEMRPDFNHLGSAILRMCCETANALQVHAFPVNHGIRRSIFG